MHPDVLHALVAQRAAQLRATAAGRPLPRSSRRRATRRDRYPWQQRLGSWLVATGLGLMVKAG